MGKDMQVSSRNIINTFLESGFGVAYLPKVSVEREVEEGRICEIQTALPKIDLGVMNSRTRANGVLTGGECLKSVSYTHLTLPTKA